MPKMTAEEWNKKYPIGTYVYHVGCIDKEFKTTSFSCNDFKGRPCVSHTGVMSFELLKYLRPISPRKQCSRCSTRTDNDSCPSCGQIIQTDEERDAREREVQERIKDLLEWDAIGRDMTTSELRRAIAGMKNHKELCRCVLREASNERMD